MSKVDINVKPNYTWNEDRVRRCKALGGLEKEVYEVYPHLFVQQG